MLISTTIIAAVILWAIVIFNKLVKNKNRVFGAWSDIDVQLKRRHNLIPKLVDVVKAYAQYEQDVMEKVTALRTESHTDESVHKRSNDESQLSFMVRNMFAVAEDYPDLKADESFLNLQNNLTEVENQIQFARRYYNGAVLNLNIMIQQFPSNLIANSFKFITAEYFEIELATQRQSPDMDFDK
ncbi:MAG: LemA family protein [Gammaproteobacteria bacterium]|nr:MAG: LemA family protein [Gammaproteobacteria bacterium]